MPELHVDNKNYCQNRTCDRNDVVDLADYGRVLARSLNELEDTVKRQSQKDDRKDACSIEEPHIDGMRQPY